MVNESTLDNDDDIRAYEWLITTDSGEHFRMQRYYCSESTLKVIKLKHCAPWISYAYEPDVLIFRSSSVGLTLA